MLVSGPQCIGDGLFLMELCVSHCADHCAILVPRDGVDRSATGGAGQGEGGTVEIKTLKDQDT